MVSKVVVEGLQLEEGLYFSGLVWGKPYKFHMFEDIYVSWNHSVVILRRNISVPSNENKTHRCLRSLNNLLNL